MEEDVSSGGVAGESENIRRERETEGRSIVRGRGGTGERSRIGGEEGARERRRVRSEGRVGERTERAGLGHFHIHIHPRSHYLRECI